MPRKRSKHLSAGSVYLRKRCLLPDGLLLQQKYIDAEWNSVTEITAAELSTQVQQRGWHSIWLVGGFSRICLGRTSESASAKAVRAGLEAISARFNAAEVDSLHVANYRGFSVARVTMRARHIQKDVSLANGMGN